MRALIIQLSILFLCPSAFNQEHQIEDIQVLDLRDRSPKASTTAASSASRNNALIIVVADGSPELILETKKAMNGLINNGFSRIGLILGKRYDDEPWSSVSIIVDGLVYATIEDAKPNNKFHSDFYRLVRDAYNEFITVKERGS